MNRREFLRRGALSAPGRKPVVPDDMGKLIVPGMSRLFYLRDHNGIELAE